MIHNLKTLHQETTKRYPQVMEKMSKEFRDYCDTGMRKYNEGSIPTPPIAKHNTGYNSLKWLVYCLREEIPKLALEKLYLSCLVEAQIQGEDVLYNNITSLPCAKKYMSLLAKPDDIKWHNYPIIKVGKWRVLINESSGHIHNLAFKHDMADVVIHDNPKGGTSIIFNSLCTAVLSDIDIQGLLHSLYLKGEKWRRVRPNIIAFGGEMGSTGVLTGAQSSQPIAQLLNLMKENYNGRR